MRSLPRRVRRFAPVVLLCAVLAACGSAATGDAPSAAGFEAGYRSMSFEQIAAAAKGQTVNWYMWGGDTATNTYVNGYVAAQLKERYEITLKQVPVGDTAEAINKVLAEKQAGKHDDGSVDLIWLNGENFRSLKIADAVFRDWADLLPSARYVDWNSPSVAYDFGYPVDYDESPWGAAQFVMEYDSAKVPQPPQSVQDLLAWACDNPGKFTYPAPPDFTGSVFVRHVLYASADDYTKLLGQFDEQVYAAAAAKTWPLLNDVKSCLWRQGTTYPQSSAQLNELFAGGEVWMSMSYASAHAASEIAKGTYPDTTRTWVFEGGTIGNTSYVAIPYNSPHKAAAMVVADFLLSPEAQLEAAKPEVLGWSTPLAPDRLPQPVAAQFEALPRSPATLDAATLNDNKLPELQAPWLTRIEQDWRASVLERE